MKNIKYFLMFFTAVAMFTACKEYADWTPGAPDTNMGVYFPELSVLNVTAEDTSVQIKVSRINTTDAAEISVRSLEVTEGFDPDTAESIFTVDRSVSFEAGSNEATLNIAFDGSLLEVGKKYALDIQLDQTEASSYAISAYVFTVIIPEPWSDWGTGTYVDDFYRVLMAAAGSDIPAGYAAPIKFQKHDLNPNRIRVVNPAGQRLFGEMWGGVPGFFVYPNEEDSYIEFDITDPNNVKLAENPAMLNVGINFGADGVLPACLFIIEDEEAGDGSYAAPIIYDNGKIIFPKDGVVMGYIADGEVNGWLANSEGMMMYATPGVVLADYSFYVEYTGMTVAADNKTTTANLDFYYGVDVDTFKFTVLEGNVTDVTEAVDAIVAGSEDIVIYEGNTDEDFASFSVNISNAGMYTVVTVPFNAEGEAQPNDAHVYSFYFPGLGANEVPSVDIQIAVGSVVDITGNPAYEADYPSATSMCIYMQADGTQIKSITAFVGTGVPAEVTDEEVLAKGKDMSDFIPDMVEKGYALAVYGGLTEGTTYDIVLGFETIYGELKTFRTTYTPTAATTPEEGGENEGGENEGGENVDPEEGGEEEETPAEPSRYQFRTFTYSGN